MDYGMHMNDDSLLSFAFCFLFFLKGIFVYAKAYIGQQKGPLRAWPVWFSEIFCFRRKLFLKIKKTCKAFFKIFENKYFFFLFQ